MKSSDLACTGPTEPEQSNGNANLGVATVSGSGGCAAYTTGCDPTAKRTVVGGIITVKPTSRDTIILEPYYGNEGNASLDAGNTNNNARWNGIIAYVTHDFNDQQEPNAFSMRVRGELFEDAGGARTCSGGVNFAGGTNTCATSGSGQAGSVFFPALGDAHTVTGTPRPSGRGPLHSNTSRFRQLQTRAEFRYDKSDQNVFLRGSEAVNNQQTLAFSVAYMW